MTRRSIACLLRWFLPVALLVIGGCGAGVRSLAPAPQGAALDYDEVFARWTRSHHLYEDFETRALVYATYFSPEFIAGYLQEYRRLYEPLADELGTLEKRLESRRIRADCFLVAMTTGERDWNDLALANSIWRVTLETSQGERQAPARIAKVEAHDASYEHFFPYYDRFKEAYLVCFDRYPTSGEVEGLPQPMLHDGLDSFSLSFRSPVGNTVLSWELSR